MGNVVKKCSEGSGRSDADMLSSNHLMEILLDLTAAMRCSCLGMRIQSASLCFSLESSLCRGNSSKAILAFVSTQSTPKGNLFSTPRTSQMCDLSPSIPPSVLRGPQGSRQFNSTLTPITWNWHTQHRWNPQSHKTALCFRHQCHIPGYRLDFWPIRSK